ncbi:MAG TPA: Zn-dependent alcohol dehydrogenase [Mycobacteriales bacterium]|nr:Zn-dependent alcohol dehydrogenase [Mycobacteriales bacterium]
MTRAAVLHQAGEPLEVADIELAPTGPRQVRVAVRAAGICHSDLSLARGALVQPVPAVLGHEAAGVVVDVGSEVTRVSPGDHVVLTWSPPCRECFFCLRGDVHLCERAVQDSTSAPYARLDDGQRLHPGLGTGGFAEETLVLERAVVPIPRDLPFEIAALLGCAVTTGVGAVLNTARVEGGSSVAVFGCGAVGLSIIQGARVAGAAQVIAVDLSPERRALAASMGATAVVDAHGEVEREIRELTDRRGVDYAFEAVGRSATIKTAWRSTRRGGTAVVVGAGRLDDTVSFNALELFYQARTLTGCYYGSIDPAVDVPRLVDLQRSGAIDVAALVTGRIGLADINSAFDDMEAGKGARSVVTFD